MTREERCKANLRSKEELDPTGSCRSQKGFYCQNSGKSQKNFKAGEPTVPFYPLLPLHLIPRIYKLFKGLGKCLGPEKHINKSKTQNKNYNHKN